MIDKNKKALLALAFVGVLAIAAAVFIVQKGPAEIASNPASPNAENTATAEPAEQITEIDVADALAERALGESRAPVKIEEFASLTCSHCAAFYNDTFPKLKSKYIDSGKVRFVFSDFPLNGPAMHASMIARCVPEDKYFDFIDTLFAEQEEWGFDPNYMEYLKAEAGKRGVNAPTYQACIQNTEIQQGIVKRMEAAQTQWQVSSTPTFVINKKKVLNGAAPYEEFVKAIEEALGNPAPVDEPEVVAPAATEETTAPAAPTQGVAVGEPNPATPAAAEATETPAPAAEEAAPAAATEPAAETPAAETEETPSTEQESVAP